MRARFFVAVVVAVACIGASSHAQQVVTTIAFTSTRDNPNKVPPITGGEIYLMDYLNGSFSIPRRVTENCPAEGSPESATATCYADTFPALSPDGRGKIVFDSNRFRSAGEPVNTSDLFL